MNVNVGPKLKTLPNFPGQVIAGPGIDVDANLVVSTDYLDFPLRSPYTPTGTDYALVFDSTNGSFFLVPANSVLGGTAPSVSGGTAVYPYLLV